MRSLLTRSERMAFNDLPHSSPINRHWISQTTSTCTEPHSQISTKNQPLTWPPLSMHWLYKSQNPKRKTLRHLTTSLLSQRLQRRPTLFPFTKDVVSPIGVTYKVPQQRTFQSKSNSTMGLQSKPCAEHPFFHDAYCSFNAFSLRSVFRNVSPMKTSTNGLPQSPVHQVCQIRFIVCGNLQRQTSNTNFVEHGNSWFDISLAISP